MGEVRLSRLAQRDLLEIWFHIAADKGPHTAVRWLALYEITKDGVRIMRVVDAARNLGELDLSGE